MFCPMRLYLCTFISLTSAFVRPVFHNGGSNPRILMAEATALNDNLQSILKRPSKTLAVVVDVNIPVGEVQSRSMQMRKLAVSALATSDISVAAELVKEQASASGDFPGPCPVIYSGPDIEKAIGMGVSAVLVSPGTKVPEHFTDVMYRITSSSDVGSAAGASAFAVDGASDDSSLEAIFDAIPNKSVILAMVESMQDENLELQTAKMLKEKGVTAILMTDSIVGDSEDVEYAEFVVSGLTRKKSSTFNMTGLTGSTNGHFGGVASTQAKTWLRQKRK